MPPVRGKAKLPPPREFHIKKFLGEAGAGRTIWPYEENIVVFSQGDLAHSLFYIQKGKIKVSVLSKGGKEAVIAMLGEGDFFGEGCLAGQPLRISTAITLTDCSIMRLEKATVIEMLQKEPAFSELLLGIHVIAHHSDRGGSGRPALQFQREKTRSSPLAAG